MSSSSNQVEVADLLRRACAALGGAAQSSAPSVTPTTSSRPAVVQEHRRLFNRQSRIQPYSASRNQARSAAAKKEKTISRTFVCLAEKEQDHVPSTAEKMKLKNNLLGEKKILLPVTGSAEAVKIVLQEAFSPLKTCGGFELLTIKEKSRTELTVVSYGSCSTEEIRCFGTGRIYIRPIQINIALADDADAWGDESENCLVCKMPIALSQMRRHMEICGSEDQDDPPPMLHSDEGVGTPSTAGVPGQDIATNVNRSPVSQALDQRSSNEPSTSGESSHTQSPPIIQPIIQATSQQRTDSESTTTERNVANSPSARDSVRDNKSVDEAVEKTIHYCDTNNITNPVEILRCFQLNMVTGRALEIERVDEAQRGVTNFIMINRENLLETAVVEIGWLTDYRKTLEVQFYNEEAQDYGGPRKEFFRLVLNEIKSTYFDDGLRELLREKYTTVGVIIGLSIIQNGKLPTFMGEDVIQSIFCSDDQRPCITELREGLKKVGIYQIGHNLPIFLHLLRPGPPQVLTVRNVIQLLKPAFSEEGSNSRKFENDVYGFFVKYLREAASGRRGVISLAHVLQFATGTDEEPVLGFVLHPSLKFVECTASFLPTANTCINCINLPRASMDVPLPSQDILFNLYDHAFVNAFFGRN